jgi:N,N'-diacetyllegionaminate synthase
VKIGSFDTDRSVFVVAEIGNNHEGKFDAACRLVEAAAASGADAVKFQTFRAELFVGRADEARFRRLKSFELSQDQFRELAGIARSKNVMFLSTPLDLPSADFLEPLVEAFKIASGDNTFYPLIERAAQSGKPLILSAGLADLAQIRRSVDFARSKGARDLAVLHCVSSYPVPPDQANLRAIPALAGQLDATIGYSDHTMGIEAAVLAAALGARIIEKHFTLDHDTSDFRDHKLSAEPGELKELVRRIREGGAMLGSGEKRAQPCEEAGLTAFRRSIVAARDLSVGSILDAKDLLWLRPGGGLAPGQEHLLVGRKLLRPLAMGERIRPADVGP